MPIRVQRTRTKDGGIPSGAIYIGRPGRWGNPCRAIYSPAAGAWQADYDGVRVGTWPTRDGANRYATEAYRRLLRVTPDRVAAARAELAGRDLACWCKTSDPCHADVLLEIANG
jgi:hypothetical protein